MERERNKEYVSASERVPPPEGRIQNIGYYFQLSACEWFFKLYPHQTGIADVIYAQTDRRFHYTITARSNC